MLRIAATNVSNSIAVKIDWDLAIFMFSNAIWLWIPSVIRVSPNTISYRNQDSDNKIYPVVHEIFY